MIPAGNFWRRDLGNLNREKGKADGWKVSEEAFDFVRGAG
jgi:hypothetical protein